MILVTTLFLYKFYREQYVMTSLSIVILFTLSLLRPDLAYDIVKLISFHLLALFICVYYRFEFISALSGKFEYLSSLLPIKFAKIMTVKDRNVDINKLFPTKDYYSVCLCSDWRNYQTISSNKDHGELQSMVENFYDIIYKELERLNKDGSYYADWTADELFIIFYDEIGKKKKLIQKP